MMLVLVGRIIIMFISYFPTRNEKVKDGVGTYFFLNSLCTRNEKNKNVFFFLSYI